MRGLLYVVFVIIGVLLSLVIGYLVEPVVPMTVSLIVFLTLFFANFVVSWIAVVLVVNGSLRDRRGREGHLDVEQVGQEVMTARRVMPWARQSPQQKTLVGDGYG
jgi:hypothetical protein